MKNFTAAGGAATAFSYTGTFLPEFIYFNPAANQLTSLKVEDQGGGIYLDLDTTGINACKNFMTEGVVTNGVFIRLANGTLLGRNITISGVTSAAGAVDFFLCGDRMGDAAYRYTKATVLPSTLTYFDKFFALFLPSLAAGDKIYVEFNDGSQQIFEREELNMISGIYQNTVGYILNNVGTYIRRAGILVASQQIIYTYKVAV
jgi:hypothetical protein